MAEGQEFLGRGRSLSCRGPSVIEPVAQRVACVCLGRKDLEFLLSSHRGGGASAPEDTCPLDCHGAGLTLSPSTDQRALRGGRTAPAPLPALGDRAWLRDEWSGPICLCSSVTGCHMAQGSGQDCFPSEPVGVGQAGDAISPPPCSQLLGRLDAALSVPHSSVGRLAQLCASTAVCVRAAGRRQCSGCSPLSFRARHLFHRGFLRRRAPWVGSFPVSSQPPPGRSGSVGRGLVSMLVQGPVLSGVRDSPSPATPGAVPGREAQGSPALSLQRSPGDGSPPGCLAFRPSLCVCPSVGC